jgi:8-oxo-dGTP pyrophosphatase MutT (NUDIX family)
MVEFNELVARLDSGLALTKETAAGDLAQAAVLILLQDSIAGAEVVLTQRALHMRLHPGETAFPGGRCDPEDADRWHTALREAQEEIALPPHRVRQLGQLEPMITRSDIEITPCVGLLLEATEFVPSPDELAAIFTAPLAYFADPTNLMLENIEFSLGRRQVPHYCFEGNDIWGVTAFMLVRLANIGYNAGFELTR